MTGREIRSELCGRSKKFSMTVEDVKARVGEPDAIHLLPRWCRHTGRDVIMLTYNTEQGQADVFGAVGFLNGEQAMLDGWVAISDRIDPASEWQDDPVARANFITGQMTLFG